MSDIVERTASKWLASHPKAVAAAALKPGDVVRRYGGRDRFILTGVPYTSRGVPCWEARNLRTHGLHTLRVDDIRRSR